MRRLTLEAVLKTWEEKDGRAIRVTAVIMAAVHRPVFPHPRNENLFVDTIGRVWILSLLNQSQ